MGKIFEKGNDCIIGCSCSVGGFQVDAFDRAVK
jgi:hypothetical protein